MARRREYPEQAHAAVKKYVEFHRYDPKKIVIGSDFEIPDRVYRGGKAKWVAYRSGKVDPSTMRKPKNPVNYIHEHDAGVMT